MNSKHILIAGMLLCVMCGLGSAVTQYIYSGSGVETFTSSSAGEIDTMVKVSSATSPFYYQVYASASGTATFTKYTNPTWTGIRLQTSGGTNLIDYSYKAEYIGEPLGYSKSCTGYLTDRGGGYYWLSTLQWVDNGLNTFSVVCSDEPFEVGIQGDTCGVDNVTCYINTTGDYIINDFCNLSTGSYEFDLANNTDYKIVFSDSHEYEFTYNGTQITYDRDVCDYITIEFFDRCGDPVDNLELFYWSTTQQEVSVTMVDGNLWDGFILGDNVNVGDNIYIITMWYSGTEKFVYLVTEDMTNIQITNIPITYEIGVQTVSNTSIPISGVQVSVTQDCNYGGTKNKITSGGWAWFSECSNVGGSLTVSKNGYKTATMPFPKSMSNNAWSYRTSYIISLETDGSVNDTSGDFNDTAIDISEVVTPNIEYDLNNNNSDIHDGVEIWFKNEAGYRTTKILDTDTYVDLWFINKNSDGSSMTLEFQTSYTGNYYWDILNWSINYNKFGFKRIYNTDFIPHDYYYRGNIYNNSIDGWDRFKILEVGNESEEGEADYTNLSTCLWFYGKDQEGKIDYHEDIRVICKAESDNTTFLSIDMELYDNGILVDYINLTWTEFAGADVKWYYDWRPDHEYQNGHNYTAKMIGYTGYILRTDHIDAAGAYRGNKLTIGVKDRFGNNLDNCYIYLEGWGSLSTGSTYYNSYEGIDNGYYRYKATKSGYTGTGWDDITMSDDDEIVWYTLTEDHTNLSATQQKLTDDDIKGMFFPLMFFLMICIIFGGFKYVTN